MGETRNDHRQTRTPFIDGSDTDNWHGRGWVSELKALRSC